MWANPRPGKTAGFAFLSIVIILGLSSYIIVHLMEDGLTHLHTQSKLNQRLGQALLNNLALSKPLESSSAAAVIVFIPDNAEFNCHTGLTLYHYPLKHGRTISYVH